MVHLGHIVFIGGEAQFFVEGTGCFIVASDFQLDRPLYFAGIAQGGFGELPAQSLALADRIDAEMMQEESSAVMCQP